MSKAIVLHFAIPLDDEGDISAGHQLAFTQIMHDEWRNYPDFHRICTEALLTFDTEAGGQSMNLSAPAPAPEKETKK